MAEPMLTVGPLPTSAAFALVAAAVASVVGALAARRAGVASIATITTALDATLIGALSARVSFVLVWWQMYMDNPWSVFQVSDGGFLVWPGLVAAALFIAWRTRRSTVMRKPLIMALASGFLIWTLLDRASMLLQQYRITLPTVELTRLDGGTVTLPALSDEPMVVNLWATWCPPCRREMPVMAAAQEYYPHVTFAFVNQGEGRERIRHYLRNEGLALDNVLLDIHHAVGRAAGSRALPTTLLFDAAGRLVDTHIGALTKPSLTAALQRFAPASSSQTAPASTMRAPLAAQPAIVAGCVSTSRLE